jgi:plasmid stability protein
MPSVQIKDVPPQTHAVLRRRAAAAHQSLQEYLRERLIAEAGTPELAEVFARIDAQYSGGSLGFDVAVESLHDDRAGR